jgi:hypothetical protein
LEADPAESKNIGAEHADIVDKAEKWMYAARIESPLWPVDYDKNQRK